MLISVGVNKHASSDEATWDIHASELNYLMIDDATALTVASWYQSPTGDGAAFAELSTTGSVDANALLHAVRSVRKGADLAAHKALDMLAMWAFGKGRKQFQKTMEED